MTEAEQPDTDRPHNEQPDARGNPRDGTAAVASADTPADTPADSGDGRVGDRPDHTPHDLPQRSGRLQVFLRNLWPPVVLGALLIGVWYFISYGVLSEQRRFLLRPPHDVVKEGFLDWDTLSEMLEALWSTTKVAAIGLAISILIGFALATLMSQAKAIERAFFPYLVTLQAVPILALVPLIIFWWGTGQNSRVVVCVIISFFPLVVNTLFGLQSASPEHHDLFSLHRVGRITRLRKLMFPAALPAIFAGLRVSAGLSVIGAIVGDFFFGRGEVGIGQLIRRFANRLQGEELLASIILSSALGVAVFLLFSWLQNRLIGKWYDGSTGI